MAPTAAQTLLSPAELSYLHSSLSHVPPIRPDARTPTQFRPLVAETDILPGTNGSARICFADGTEAIVGIKAEVEKTTGRSTAHEESHEDVEMAEGGAAQLGRKGMGDKSWVEMTIEIPGYRDDDALPVYLAAMLNEALLATGELPDKLWINRRFHWKLFIDVLLLSPPLSYPVPLLSMTTHLALRSTRLPALISEADEDPLFDDDWDASIHLYSHSEKAKDPSRPPVTLLVVSAGENILFDPSREELAVADAILAISLGTHSTSASSSNLEVLAVRTIDPPSRITTPGVPDSMNTATGAVAGKGPLNSDTQPDHEGVWKPPRGGMPRSLVSRVVSMCVSKGGVAEEVLAGLDGFIGG